MNTISHFFIYNFGRKLDPVNPPQLLIPNLKSGTHTKKFFFLICVTK